MVRALALGLMLGPALWGGGAEAACRQALALGLDVSGSVDAAEYRLQTDGLAAALTHPEVVEAVLAIPDAPVRLMVFEWSGPAAQRVVVPWTDLSGPGDLAAVAARLRGTARADMDPSTAIGSAKAFGTAQLALQGACWRRVLDLSGDGTSNTGPRPQDVTAAGFTVNGLVIAEPETGSRQVTGLAELSAYYRAWVIEGPEAFVETANGFAAFEAAMVRKLKREMQVMVLGARQ